MALLFVAASTAAHAAPVTYVYTGNNFNSIGNPTLPAGTNSSTSDRIVGEFDVRVAAGRHGPEQRDAGHVVVLGWLQRRSRRPRRSSTESCSSQVVGGAIAGWNVKLIPGLVPG